MSVINSMKECISWETNSPSIVTILPFFHVTQFYFCSQRHITGPYLEPAESSPYCTHYLKFTMNRDSFQGKNKKFLSAPHSPDRLWSAPILSGDGKRIRLLKLDTHLLLRWWWLFKHRKSFTITYCSPIYSYVYQRSFYL
jgi:hypothetical protein